jgi:predicted permease
LSAFLFLLACLLLGAAVARLARPPARLSEALNGWVINIALPALVLELVPKLSLAPDLWLLVVSQWGVFAGAFLLFRSAGRALRWSDARIGALTLVCGLGNTSFMGYPMIEALRGREALALAVVADQVGCFLMLATGGVIVAVLYGGGAVRPRELARRVLLFPPFVAMCVGAAAGAAGGWPPLAEQVLHAVGLTLTPLALFAVGLRVQLRLAREQLAAAGIGLSWKLLLAPLAVLALGQAAGVTGLTLTVAVLQAGIAPMISAAILADQHRLEPALANAVLGAGILLSLRTVPLWNALL